MKRERASGCALPVQGAGKSLCQSSCFLHSVQKPPRDMETVLGIRTPQFGDGLGSLGLESYQMPSLWPLAVGSVTLFSGPSGVGWGGLSVPLD